MYTGLEGLSNGRGKNVKAFVWAVSIMKSVKWMLEVLKFNYIEFDVIMFG